MKNDNRKRSMLKSVTWRIFGVFWLGLISWFFTRNLMQTTLTTVIHHGLFLVIFYLHERAWQKIKMSKKLRPFVKSFTYEIVLGNLILGLITFLITGNIKIMTSITLTYIFTKIPIYWFNEKLWFRKKVVYAYAVADILHVGHLKHLERAKAQGDYLIVGALSDKATMEKKPEPTINFAQRIELLEGLKCVDEVVPQFDYSPLSNVKSIRPDVLMESVDHKEQPANDFVNSYGGEVIQSPYYPKQSSSMIKAKIKHCCK